MQTRFLVSRSSFSYSVGALESTFFHSTCFVSLLCAFFVSLLCALFLALYKSVSCSLQVCFLLFTSLFLALYKSVSCSLQVCFLLFTSLFTEHFLCENSHFSTLKMYFPFLNDLQIRFSIQVRNDALQCIFLFIDILQSTFSMQTHFSTL